MTDAIVIPQPSGGVSAVIPQPTPASPMSLLQLAIEKGMDVGTLERLQAMCERAADRAAAQEFAEALAAFQREAPDVSKSRTATVPTKSGGTYSYSFANLDDIVRAVGASLAKHGLSYTFDSVMDEKGMVEVCTIRHVGGHAVQSRSPVVTMEASTPGLSPQQRVGNAQTYARRYALTGALGITTGDRDNDTALEAKEARMASDARITEQQREMLVVELDMRQIPVDRFLLGCDRLHGRTVESLDDIEARHYATIMKKLQRSPEVDSR